MRSLAAQLEHEEADRNVLPPAGVRPMAISSGIMMALAATWTTAKRELL